MEPGNQVQGANGESEIQGQAANVQAENQEPNGLNLQNAEGSQSYMYDGNTNAVVVPHIPDVNFRLVPNALPNLMIIGPTNSNGFLNASIQCLAYCGPALSFLCDPATRLHAPTPEHLAESCLECELRQVMVDVNLARSNPSSTITLDALLQALIAKISAWNLPALDTPEDFIEFMMSTLASNEAVSRRRLRIRSARDTPAKRLFGLMERETVTCQECYHEKVVHETDFCTFLARDFPGVTATLNAYYDGAPREAECNRSGCGGTTQRTVSVIRAPRVLIFCCSDLHQEQEFPFPHTLDMTPYMHASYEGDSIKYKLTGVVVLDSNEAEAESPTYHALVKVGNNQWRQKYSNGSYILSEQDVNEQQPYMLFYRRVEKQDRTKFVNQVRSLARQTNNLVPKAPFGRLVREVAQDLDGGRVGIRYTETALAATQEAAEHYVTQFMEDANRCAIHGKRVTVQPKDMRLVRKLRHGDN